MAVFCERKSMYYSNCWTTSMMNVIWKCMLLIVTIWVFTFFFAIISITENVYERLDQSLNFELKLINPSSSTMYKKNSFWRQIQRVLATKFSGFIAQKLGFHTTHHRKWASFYVHPV